MSSSRTSGAGAVKRLLKELEAWRAEHADAEDGDTTAGGVERLGPLHESDLLTWEAVINGRGVGGGYDGTESPSSTFSFSFSLVPSYSSSISSPG